MNNSTTNTPPTIKEDASLKEVIQWLTWFVGDTFLSVVKKQEIQNNLKEHSSTEWLENLLKSKYEVEDLNLLKQQIYKRASDYQKLLEKVKEWEDIREKVKAVKQLTLSAESTTSNNISSVSQPKNVEEIFGQNSNIYMLFQEALEEKSRGLNAFLKGFIQGWEEVQNILEDLPKQEEEKKNLKIVHSSLTKFLAAIKGLHIPQRRALLEEIAIIVSNKFKSFIFVSPEETLQVDPNIHNAMGIGGTEVKEGISYAVLRKRTKQVYIYADIEVV